MPKGGYTVVDKQLNAVKADGIPWLSPSFELDDTSPDNLAVFFHISFALTEGTVPQQILMSKNDGSTYQPINNNSIVDGWFYRSDVLTKGNKLNFKIVGAIVILSEFVLMLEE